MEAARALVFACLVSMLTAAAAVSQELPAIEQKTAGLSARTGFFTVYWDEVEGKVWLEISRFDENFLYLESLSHGLGSNDVGLDRTQLGDRLIVRFERYGPKILLVTPNMSYRTVGASEAEARSVAEAFADGVLWGFEAAAASEGRVLVDATDFIVRDAHGVVDRLKSADQGSFALDQSRSAPVPDVLKSFPDNTEMEARLTFTSDSPGPFVRDVAALPSSFSVRIRHSFVRLPGPGFRPRAFHPRAGFFGPQFQDYSRPIGEEMTVRLIARHRLEKKDQRASVSEPREPIVYYLDPGTPEPVRSALLEGASWWADAFEAAGFRDAFRVEILPDGADPLDVRYNVIQWVHRATRGWSYGDAVTDPRTGEIIKGHVLLGSLRVRQDYLLAEGLLAPYDEGRESGLPAGSDPMLDMALARIRQLSAHEIGHTLGLAHNFAASAAGRSSVMDYPAPFASASGDERISIDSAYAVGVGEWDKLAIRYGYGEPAPGETVESYLAKVLSDAEDAGIEFITDSDARPSGAAHPYANLWDNGADMIRALEREMEVRRVALSRFGSEVLRAGRPLALAEEVLVPLYLRHRYQIEATVKMIAGVRYSYALRGDAGGVPEAVDGGLQRDALAGLLETLEPDQLALPEQALRVLAPRPFGYPSNRELFARHTGLTFDPYTPAEALARHVISLLLDPERASRLVYQADFDRGLPSFVEVLDAAAANFFTAVPDEPDRAELQRVVQQVWVDGLVRLSLDEAASPAVVARAVGALRELSGRLVADPGPDAETRAWRSYLAGQIDRFISRGFGDSPRPPRLDIPPGSPIGSYEIEGVSRRFNRSMNVLGNGTSDAVCMWSSALR